MPRWEKDAAPAVAAAAAADPADVNHLSGPFLHPVQPAASGVIEHGGVDRVRQALFHHHLHVHQPSLHVPARVLGVYHGMAHLEKRLISIGCVINRYVTYFRVPEKQTRV